VRAGAQPALPGLFGGDPMRAVVHLAEALRRGQDGPAVRYPLGQAERALSSQRMVLDHGARVSDAVFSPAGDLLLTAREDGRVLAWDARRGDRLRSLAVSPGAAQQLTVSPDGTLLLAAGNDGVARLFHLPDGEPRPLATSFHGELTPGRFTSD